MIMLNRDIDTIDKESEIREERRAESDKSIPPECDPEKYLDWRFRYAHHLAEHAEELPIQHGDAWVEHAANFLATPQVGNVGCSATDAELAIRDALAIYSSDSLVREVLEARLLAQQSPGYIAGKCRLDELAIVAYEAVFFSVRGHQRMQVWCRENYLSSPPGNSLVQQLGSVVKRAIFTQGPVGIEDRIGVLLELGADTLADGLSEPASPEFQRTFYIRQEFAGPLLPHNRTASRLYDRFRQVAAGRVSLGRTSYEAILAGMEVLRMARISLALQHELHRLRQHHALFEELVSETDGEAVACEYGDPTLIAVLIHSGSKLCSCEQDLRQEAEARQ
jgi:hypothetical protein